MTSSLLKTALLPGTAALLLFSGPAEAAKPQLNDKALTLTAGHYKVEFRPEAAYTLGRVTFQEAPLLRTTGANQTVINIKVAEQASPDAWIGTAHGREEIVSLNLEVNGQSYPIDDAFDAPEGESYTLRKVSRLGPLEATSATTVSAGGIDQTVQLKAVGSEPEVRYAYTFMHCLNPTFHDWMAVAEDGSVLGERFPEERINSLKRDVRRIAFYDEEKKIGLALIYPEAYQGDRGVSNMLINWPGRHYKHYLRMSPEQAVAQEYRCSLVAFPAEPDGWQQSALKAGL